MRFSIALVLGVAACGPKATDSATATEPEPATASEPATAAEPAAEPAAVAEPATASEPATARDVLLKAHNDYRTKHCAPPLEWSDELAKVAQAWANKLKAAGCAFDHSGSKYGENLAAGTSGAMPPEHVVEMWYREVERYNFKRGGFSMETGHFTQLVWKNTRRVGCGMTTCKGYDYWVCNYDPAGNYERQYKANVLPASCK